MNIITNWQPRALLCLADLTESERKEFDYVDDEFSTRFVRYRGELMDAMDTQRIEPDNERTHPMGWAMRVHPGSPLCLFDSVISDSYFSGHLFRFCDDETVIVGRYYS